MGWRGHSFPEKKDFPHYCHDTFSASHTRINSTRSSLRLCVQTLHSQLPSFAHWESAWYPMLPVCSGAMMDQKMVEFMHDCAGIEEHLTGLCFDTAASNTGIHTGAITVLQQSLKPRLLFLACRHPMLEDLRSCCIWCFLHIKWTWNWVVCSPKNLSGISLASQNLILLIVTKLVMVVSILGPFLQILLISGPSQNWVGFEILPDLENFH